VSSEHPNAANLRAVYEAMAARDIATIDANLADDVVFHLPGESEIAGDYRGKQEVFGLFGRWVMDTEGTFAVDLVGVLANDSHAVALQRVTAERQGKHLEMDNLAVYAVDADGKVVERWEFLEDVAAHDDFWS
jgi:ketosteroid isomerase-like protein